MVCTNLSYECMSWLNKVLLTYNPKLKLNLSNKTCVLFLKKKAKKKALFFLLTH